MFLLRILTARGVTIWLKLLNFANFFSLVVWISWESTEICAKYYITLIKFTRHYIFAKISYCQNLARTCHMVFYDSVSRLVLSQIWFSRILCGLGTWIFAVREPDMCGFYISKISCCRCFDHVLFVYKQFVCRYA